jgi:hypothetical protein
MIVIKMRTQNGMLLPRTQSRPAANEPKQSSIVRGADTARRACVGGTLLVVVVIMTFSSPLASVAAGQELEPPARSKGQLGGAWMSRIDPWHGIPTDLAHRFGESALSAGLAPSEAARLLNDGRFVAAVGSPDQGWGMLEAMIEDPNSIADAWNLLREQGDLLTVSGVTSFQYVLMVEHPELRNAYLGDLGRMIAVRPDGAEVLVDLDTGLQVIGQDKLGIPIRAPGGAPLPTPSISPEEAAANMWEDVGVDPGDPDPGQVSAADQQGKPTGPGFNFDLEPEKPSQGLLTPGLYLVAGGFLIAWLGFATVIAARRFRRP